MKLNFKGVKADVWTRAVVLLIALISEILVITGKRTEGINIDTWQEYAATIAVIISSLWGFWKNNSFTEAAQLGDQMKDIAKSKKDFNYDDEIIFLDMKFKDSEGNTDVNN